MKKILVAYDCSTEAKKAAEHAFSIADADVEIIILTVIPEPETVYCTSDDGMISDEAINKWIESMKEKYQSKELCITQKTRSGEVVGEIIKASEDPDVKLIVMGYKGVSKIGNFKLGSVSGEVAKLAKKPVLVVK